MATGSKLFRTKLIDNQTCESQLNIMFMQSKKQKLIWSTEDGRFVLLDCITAIRSNLP
jgi:hypothetical protein